MKTCDMEWIVGEVAAIDFGDKRLNDRVIKTAIVLASKPSATIAEASPSKAVAKGAYRMFSNPRVDEDEILRSHLTESLERAKKCDVIYAIQDTTSLNFTGHDLDAGFGTIGYNSSAGTTGLFVHTTLMISESGRPLGLLDQMCYDREPKPKSFRKSQKDATRKKFAKDKESKRWLDALQQTASCQAIRDKVVTLADRECDIYEFVATANQLSSKFIIRCCRNRNTAEGEKIFCLLKQAEVIGQHSITIPVAGKPTLVDLDVKCIETEILPPSDRTLKTRSTEVEYVPQRIFVIEAREKTPPTDRPPLHWILLTNIPTKSFQDAVDRLKSYAKRWAIEEFHRILKSGCGIEKTPLESADAVRIMIVLKSIIAVRLFQLTKAWRETPDIPCTVELSGDEWHALHMRVFPGKPLQEETPTLKQASLWIAQLGGYKRNPQKEPPGMIVMWRGWQELRSCVAMLVSFRMQDPMNLQTCG